MEQKNVQQHVEPENIVLLEVQVVQIAEQENGVQQDHLAVVI